jgi:hypothetical protein
MRLALLRAFTVAIVGLVLSGCDPAAAPSQPAAPALPSVPGMPAPAVPVPAANPLSQEAMKEKHQQSMQRLRALGRALLAHSDQLGTLPPAYIADAAGKPLYSWRVVLLPYLGHQDLYNRFDKSKAWDDPANLEVSNTPVDAFKSPADPTVAANGANYLAIVGEGCVFSGPKPHKLLDILDGTANTLAVIECQGVSGSWAAPIDLQKDAIRLEVGAAPDQLHSPYPQGIQILRVDTSVGFISADKVPEVFPRTLSIAGGERRELDD